MKTLLELLKKKGLGYREGFGGNFESTYSHHEYTLHIVIDKNGTDIRMVDSDGESESIGSCGVKETIYDEIYEALIDASMVML